MPVASKTRPPQPPIPLATPAPTADHAHEAGFSVALESLCGEAEPTANQRLTAAVAGCLARERWVGAPGRPGSDWAWPVMRDASTIVFCNWHVICQVAERFAAEDAAAGVPR